MDKYHSVANPAAYGGQNLLYETIKPDKTRKQVIRFLKTNKTYRKFKRNVTKFERARIFVNSISVMFQTDLFDMQRLSRYNSGFRYILLLVDVYSRRIWAKPLKNKTGQVVAENMRQILMNIKQLGILAPRALIFSDLGSEYWNVDFAAVLDNFNITHLALRAKLKCSMAELSGRWLLDRIYKFMHAKDTKNWVDNFSKFVVAKNNRKLPRLGGLAPAEVSFKNQSSVYENIYPKTEKKTTKPLRIGQKVQIAMDRMPFTKSFAGYFTEKIYEIKRCHNHKGIFRYTIQDSDDGAEISGTYYASELQPLIE